MVPCGMVSSAATVTLDKKHIAKAQALADASNMRIDDVIARAIDHYIEYTKFVRNEVTTADRDIEQGKVYTLDETKKRIQERRRVRRTAKTPK